MQLLFSNVFVEFRYFLMFFVGFLTCIICDICIIFSWEQEWEPKSKNKMIARATTRTMWPCCCRECVRVRMRTIVREMSESENESTRDEWEQERECESKRWFRMSARRGRDKFNLTNTISILWKTDVNMSSLMLVFGKLMLT